MVVFAAWRSATLVRAKRIPALTRLLRARTRKSHAEQEAIRAEMAAAEAEFARLEAEARSQREAGGDG